MSNFVTFPLIYNKKKLLSLFCLTFYNTEYLFITFLAAKLFCHVILVYLWHSFVLWSLAARCYPLSPAVMSSTRPISFKVKNKQRHTAFAMQKW